MARSLVVKVTAGQDDPERCNQALTVAAAAAASGVPVSLWLTGEASWFALPGRRRADRAAARVCRWPNCWPPSSTPARSPCARQCAARREISEDDVLEGVRIAGAATFLAEVLADGAQALVY